MRLMKGENMINDMEQYAEKAVGPVMFEYTHWILHKAQQKGFKKIYFLARDGYLLQKIAEAICKASNLAIECRYFYCSRNSLRMPSYHMIGDEAMELLTLYGYHITPDSILSRAWLSDTEKERILDEMKIDKEHRFCHMDKSEYDDFKAKLYSCNTFRKLVKEMSEKEYDSAIRYIRQEGMLDDDKVVIADSGWTGSMQRSLRQLLDSCGYKGKLYGFYFGMYTLPKSNDDGEYLTFYFDANSGIKHKTSFNNNLFECMLSAPHPMTVRYQIEEGKSIPVFAKSANAEMLEMVRAQITGALKYTETRLSSNFEFGNYSYNVSVKKCYKIIRKKMVYPSSGEAEMYSRFAFCDDVTEGYHRSLADSEQKVLLKNYMMVPRLINKLFKKKCSTEPLFWPYGIISFCPALVRPWYRMNVMTWEWLKAILKK